MNIILLSGGSGTRLWPLSNGVRSKQFLKILKKEDGTNESMAQRMYRMIKKVDKDANVTIATSKSQIPQIKAQLGDDVRISVEPCRMDTFPAIALAVAFLKKNGVKDEEPVIVCPIDPYVNEDYFECLNELNTTVSKSDSNLVLMGIEPSNPSSKFGYIIPENTNHISRVKEFKEKPDTATAIEYIKQGALWNGGVFAFKLGYVLSVIRRELGTDNYEELDNNYPNLKRISFDYAVVEKERDISVIRFNGQWKDLGTWDTITEAMDEQIRGNATVVKSDNTHVINELSIPLVVLGMNNAVVVATPDGVLVSDKAESDSLKNYVEENRPMCEKRPWGEYKILDCKIQNDECSIVKKLIISQGQHISYQLHHKRTEMWTIIGGVGELIVDDFVRRVERGDCVVIRPNTKHGIKSISELHIIEVQIGDELSEDDIERLDWNW